MQKVNSPPKGLLEARIREELGKKYELLNAECVSLRHQLEEANKAIEKTRTKEMLLMNRWCLCSELFLSWSVCFLELRNKRYILPVSKVFNFDTFSKSGTKFRN